MRRRRLLAAAGILLLAALAAMLLPGRDGTRSPGAPADDGPAAVSPAGGATAAAGNEDDPPDPDPDWPVVRGRVVVAESGAPVRGAEVDLRGRLPTGDRQSGDAVTGPDGRFAVPVPLRDGKLDSLEVGADGYRPWLQTDLPFSGEEIAVPLERSARLTVRVVSAEDGRPVSGVRVTAEFGSLTDLPDDDERRSDESGRAVFSRIPGRHVRLDACGNGHRVDWREVPEERRSLTLDPGEEREVTLPVVRTAVVRGRVTSASGEPVSRASLTCGSPSTGFSRWWSAKDDGSFRLADLLPGEYVLSARRGELRGSETTVRVGPGEERGVELALPAGGWLELTVRAEDGGAALAGARVRLDAVPRGRSESGYTDDAGRLRLGPVRPGKFRLRVGRRGHLPAEREVELAPGDPTRFEVALSPGGSVTGRVRLPGGTGVEGAHVGWYGGVGTLSFQRARTGPDGSFELRGLPDRELEIQASFRDGERRKWSCRQIVAAGARGVVLTLEPEWVGARVKAEILVAAPGGKPVDRAEVLVFGIGPDGAVCWEEEAEVAAGRAEFDRFSGRAAAIRVWVSGARTPAGTPLPLGPAGAGPFPLDRGRIEVALPRESVVAGTVRDPSGRGLGRVEVEALVVPCPGADPRSSFGGRVLAEPDGTFRIGGLPEGRVELVADPPGDLVQPAPVHVSAGATDVAIGLARLVPAVVKVVGPDGRPAKDIRVEAFQEAGIGDDPHVGWSSWDGRGRTGPDGVVRFRDLVASAPYRLLCRRADTAVPLAPRRIDGWRPRDTTVRLGPVRWIAGRAVRADGRPFDGGEGQIWSWNRVTGWDLVLPDEEGEFRETGLPDGPVALVWTPGDVDPRDEPERGPDRLGRPVAWVAAGSEDIVFAVPLR